jgi:hypothetical protein
MPISFNAGCSWSICLSGFLIWIAVKAAIDHPEIKVVSSTSFQTPRTNKVTDDVAEPMRMAAANQFSLMF